jgi:cyanate lyase
MRRCIGQRATSSVLTTGAGKATRHNSALAAGRTGHARFLHPVQCRHSPVQCRNFSVAGTTNPAAKAAATARLLQAKQAVGLTFQELADIIEVHEVFLASAVYGQNSLTADTAKHLLQALKISDDSDLLQALTDYPLKTGLSEAVPTDPLIYRFHEITQIYGVSIKAIIQEKFGDGIMSAIDFKMDIQKKEDPKGDRVIVTMNGKFLPYNKW